MPVIINDFEVIVENPTPQRALTPPTPPRPAPRPDEMDRIMQHFASRRARVHAD
ncbi:MAG: hypothetical protein OHK0046_41850 [Anaerolineae bacterium]